ncbi:hypothetical protein CFIO01_00051 [Colletotrichum fioriniae PJ7]|uniref:AsqO/PenF-like C-terminal domain-containing protein n=1 Tax=Colletotrichum fioriniae PJ7 TaxID=1445577 RepID=A0A010S6G2_9PEZI|nr:hypothetical protein CFIO01_00051 [Colletotrichum fioriniae PJ7]
MNPMSATERTVEELSTESQPPHEAATSFSARMKLILITVSPRLAVLYVALDNTVSQLWFIPMFPGDIMEVNVTTQFIVRDEKGAYQRANGLVKGGIVGQDTFEGRGHYE